MIRFECGKTYVNLGVQKKEFFVVVEWENSHRHHVERHIKYRINDVQWCEIDAKENINQPNTTACELYKMKAFHLVNFFFVLLLSTLLCSCYNHLLTARFKLFQTHSWNSAIRSQFECNTVFLFGLRSAVGLKRSKRLCTVVADDWIYLLNSKLFFFAQIEMRLR